MSARPLQEIEAPRDTFLTPHSPGTPRLGPTASSLAQAEGLSQQFSQVSTSKRPGRHLFVCRGSRWRDLALFGAFHHDPRPRQPPAFATESVHRRRPFGVDSGFLTQCLSRFGQKM